jgi:hypothetical protein
MMPAIKFYDQFMLWGTEVCNIVLNGMLPTKLNIA